MTRLGKLAGVILASMVVMVGLASLANAQSITRICVQTKNTSNGVTTYSCPDVTSTYPLPMYTSEPVSGLTGTQSSTGTSAVTVFNAPTIGQIHISGIQMSNSSGLSSMAEVVAGPANTIIWQGINPGTGGNDPTLGVPIAAGTGLSVGCLFTVAATTQFCNLQGYQGP